MCSAPVALAPPSTRRRPPTALLAILLLAACAYAPTLSNGFTWDDEYALLKNQAVRSAANIPRMFSDATTSASYGGLVVYRPFRTAAFALAFQAWGLAPVGYHALNLLLHLIAVVLVHAVVRKMVDERRALLVAALFAVHPINSEAVAGVVGLGDLLSAAFMLGALRLHLDVAGLQRGDRARAAAVAALFGCALLSKETAIVFPLLVAWLELVILRNRREVRRGYFLYVGGLFALAAAFFLLRTVVIGGLNAGRYEGITLGRTLWMQADVLARYLRLVALPVGLSVRHSIPVPISFFEPRTLIAIAVLVAVVAAAALARRRAPLVTFGVGWFFIALLPVMNVIPLPGAMMGERFCYVPVIGLLLVLAEAARRAVGTTDRPPASFVPVAAAVASAVLSVATFSRSGQWRDNLTLFEAAAQVAPDSNAVRINLIREYQRIGDEQAARLHWQAAVANTRAYASRYTAIAARAESEGNAAEAAAWYRRALGLAPDDAAALAGIARLGVLQGTSEAR